MALKDLIRSIHGPSTVIPALDLYLVQREEEDRSDAWHPSGFCSMCARAHLLQRILNISTPVSIIEPKQKRIFDVGKALHWWYQNKYFGPMNILWGKWKCRSCNLVQWGLMPQGKCIRCSDSGTYYYKEIPIVAKLPGCEKPIRGRCDGLLYLGSEWLSLEIKTINEDGFRFLGSPYPGAIAQAQVYSELIRQKHVLAPSEIFIPTPSRLMVLYINKNDSTEKEFIIDLDSKLAKQKISEPIKFEVGLREKKLPPKWEVCKDKLDKPARYCNVKVPCFQELTWEEYQKVA